MGHANVPVPKELRGSFVRYGEIIREERRLFWLKLKRVVFLGLPLSFTFLYWLGPLFELSGPSLFVWSFILMPLIPAIDVDYRRKKLGKDRERLKGYFAKQGLRICHDMNLRVDVVAA